MKIELLYVGFMSKTAYLNIMTSNIFSVGWSPFGDPATPVPLPKIGDARTVPVHLPGN